jgi:hypothetical protein
MSRYFAQAGEVPIRDFLRETWGYIQLWAVGSFICSAVAVLFFALASVVGLPMGSHGLLFMCGYITLFWGLISGTVLLTKLPESAQKAEERIGLRFELRRALGDAVNESDSLDEDSLLNLRWRGLRAISVADENTMWNWDTKIVDETGKVVVHDHWLGNRERYTPLLRAWLEAVTSISPQDSKCEGALDMYEGE